jgi:hypothetical protein
MAGKYYDVVRLTRTRFAATTAQDITRPNRHHQALPTMVEKSRHQHAVGFADP